MSRGKLNIQAADGAVIGLVVPDGLTSEERQISLGVNLSGITAYHLLQGNLSVSASTVAQGMNTTLYTGNGTTQSITTGIDMNTQWGGTVEEKFGGLVWFKNRSGIANHQLLDTVRGTNKIIFSSTTDAEATDANTLTSFNNNGITLGTGQNTSATTFASWNFQTTHRVSGTTNHGKAYTCHYNPFTGFTIVKYEGSGIAGHEIPHMLGRPLEIMIQKDLSATVQWLVSTKVTTDLALNTTAASDGSTRFISSTDKVVNSAATGAANVNGNQTIIYGWANSYIDESNKLIGNYELIPYQGTGAAGNKVITKGKPAWVMIKRVDSIGSWGIFDNQRNIGVSDPILLANLSNAEAIGDYITFYSDSFTLSIGDANTNVSGGTYIALVAYDTNANGGGSYYPLASDTANVQVNNALIPLAQGIDGNGSKNTILSKNETITGLTYTQGKNYVYCDKNGAYGVTPHKPRYLESELVRTYASEAPEYFDVLQNKWFSTSGQGELVSNGTFDSNTTGWTADGSNILSVSSGTMLVNRNNSTANGAKQTITTTIGKKYNIRFKVTSLANSGIPLLYIGSTANGTELGTYSNTTTGTFEYSFIAQSTSTYLQFGVTTSVTGIVGYDDISVFATDIVPTTEITNSRNYLNHIVHADNDGGVLYVEELPKIEYKDVVKANEYQGKNACTAWVNFDGTTTPPTIRDSYNVSSVIRTATGTYCVYFEEPMDTNNYSISTTSNEIENLLNGYNTSYAKIVTRNNTSTNINALFINISFFGGKN